MGEIRVYLLVSLFSVVSFTATSSPLYAGSTRQSKEIIEGDILVTKPLVELMSEHRSRSRREITTNTIKRWPKGVIPFAIDERLGKAARKAIRRAIREFHKHTCVQFTARTNQRDYVRFNYDYGCYSPIGRQGGEQKLSVGDGCEYRGTVMHEMMHTLGFFHEHSRYDRDKHVKILWWNIERGFLKNFNVYSHGIMDTLDTPYDYNSLMHYDQLAFSKNRRNTIQAIDQPDRALGQKESFSETDIKQLLKVYPCRAGSRRQAQPKTTKTRTRVRKHKGHCKDLFPSSCKLFASHAGYCSDWKSFMRKYCPVSCNLCHHASRLEIWSSGIRKQQTQKN